MQQDFSPELEETDHPLRLSAPSAPVLQRSAPIQAKLEVGGVDDPYEREADQVAERVVRSLSSDRPVAVASSASGGDDSRRVRRAGVGTEGGTVDAETERVIASSTGRPMPEATRRPMESAFGADFSGVRVHEGAAANVASRRIQASAFTRGSDVYFRDRLPSIGSSSGQRLIAHELTHTIQQGAARATGDSLRRATDRIQRAHGATDAEADLINALRTGDPDMAVVGPLIADPNVAGALDDTHTDARHAATHNVAGRTLLGHCAGRNDTTAAMAALVAAGADINGPDIDGRTPLHRAAYRGHLPVINWLVLNGADADATDAANWLPYDVAVAAGKKPAAAALQAAHALAAPAAPDPRALNLGPGAHTTPQILAAATKSMDPAVTPAAILAMYQDLYRFDDLKPVLDVAALEAAESRAIDDNALRLFLSDTDSTLVLRAAFPHGSYNDVSIEQGGAVVHKTEGTVTVGGNRPGARTVIGTLMHELTHHAARKIFNNNAVPILTDDTASLRLYLAAYSSDAARFVDNVLAPQTSAAREIGFEQIEAGYGKIYLQLQEIIVRAPQTMAMFGEVAEEALPKQVAFYRQNFLPAARAFCAGHAQLAQLNNVGAASAPLSTLAGPERIDLTAVTPAQLRSAVETALNGRASPNSGGYRTVADRLLAEDSDMALGISGVSANPAARGAARGVAEDEADVDADRERRLLEEVENRWGQRVIAAGTDTSMARFDTMVLELSLVIRDQRWRRQIRRGVDAVLDSYL